MKIKVRPKAFISSRLSIPKVPTWFADECWRVSAFRNPSFIAAQRFSPWGQPSKSIPEWLNTVEQKPDGTLVLPRGFNAKKVLSDRGEAFFNSLKVIDERVSVPVLFPDYKKGSLSPEQEVLIKSVYNCIIGSIRPFGNIALSSPTGTGKTRAQAVSAAITGQRTLVLCLTNLIKDAWYDDLKELYTLKTKEIGLIQQKSWTYGELFTLASVSTLCKHPELWPEVYRTFGTVVMDEHHTCTQPRVFDFLNNCPAKYLIGASATPKKLVLNEQVEAIFGSPVKSLILNSVETKSSLPLTGVDVTKTDFQFDYIPGALDNNALLDAFTVDEDRNSLIVEHAINDYREGKVVMICTKRLAHVEVLHTMLQELGIKDCNLLTGATNANRRYSKGLKQAVFSGKVRMIVACTQAIKLGANFNPVDRLHLAVPIPNPVNLEQLIGRIRRQSAGKVDCRLRYYLDMKVPYLFNVFKIKAAQVFTKLRVPEYDNVYMA